MLRSPAANKHSSDLWRCRSHRELLPCRHHWQHVRPVRTLAQAAAPSSKQQMLVRPCQRIRTSSCHHCVPNNRAALRHSLPTQVYVPSHPLVKHWLAVARNKLSPPPVFRSALAELGRLLIYEAIEQEGWLPTVEGQAETPCGIADVTFIDPSRPVKVGPCALGQHRNRAHACMHAGGARRVTIAETVDGRGSVP